MPKIIKLICNLVAPGNYYFCKVKYIAFILSLYFLGLNFTPCNDEVATISCENMNCETDARIDSEASSYCDGEKEDLCSPFCKCHCCHVHVINLLADSFDVFSPGFPSGTFAHSDSLGKELSFSLLQPPRFI